MGHSRAEAALHTKKAGSVGVGCSVILLLQGLQICRSLLFCWASSLRWWCSLQCMLCATRRGSYPGAVDAHVMAAGCTLQR